MKGCLLVIFATLFIIALSWLTTCGLLYLITLCFGWAFSWSIATGIWLVLLLLSSIFGSNSSKK